MKFQAFTFPERAPVRQTLYRSSITAVEAAVRESLHRSALFTALRPGTRIAVAVGSRGITHLDRIVTALLDYLKATGLSPFIVPAMGSHGGATAEGQRQVLAALGITEAGLGVGIQADMAADCIAHLDCGMKVFVSRQARSADHIFVVNRVKPHTKFSADTESGLLKMLAVGLGMADGAAEIHRFAVRRSFEVIPQAAQKVLAACPVLGGLAILEDGYGAPARFATVAATDMMTTEKELLRLAAGMMPRLPVENVDLLIVDWIGKNISGVGMDSKVTGRHRDITGDFHLTPHAKRIFVRNLALESRGNANGIGLADFTTTRLVTAMDRSKTYTNALAAISPEKAAIPIWFDSDREAIAAAINCCGLTEPESARIVRIKDTAHLETFQVSRAFEPEIRANPSLAMAGDWSPMQFDPDGNLADEL